LDALELSEALLKSFTELGVFHNHCGLGVLVDLDHELTPLIVHVLEDATLHWHLIQNVLGGENWLQIQPG